MHDLVCILSSLLVADFYLRNKNKKSEIYVQKKYEKGTFANVDYTTIALNMFECQIENQVRDCGKNLMMVMFRTTRPRLTIRQTKYVLKAPQKDCVWEAHAIAIEAILKSYHLIIEG